MSEFLSTEKAQPVRLLDVFLIGPVMIAGGLKLKDSWLGYGLIVFGASTIVYNGINYLENK